MFIKIVWLWLGLLVAFAAQAQIPAAVDEALKRANIPQEAVAIYVQAVDATTPMLQHQAAQSMNPASVMKLVTTQAALELLSPDYRWKTEVYRDGMINNGVLEGNLIIKGDGDPSFKSQDFWRLLMRLQQTGIKEIKGDLLIDNSLFSQVAGAPMPFDAEIWRAYNALPSAFLVNGRSTSFRFSATAAAVNVDQEFELAQIHIDNQLKLGAGECGDWRNQLTYTVKNTLQNNEKNTAAKGVTVTFNGTYSEDCGERFLELSVLNDTEYAFFTFKQLWQMLGGKFSGQLVVNTLPVHSAKIFEQTSEPLANVIRDINKWSNNLMARQLLLTLAAEKAPLPADEAKGARIINDWLQAKGFNFNELVIENGAGLSRIERISAEHLGVLLVRAYHNATMPEFMASMPILGVDGTVKKRLSESPVQGQAHLKTGSLNGVSTVAGYLLNQQQQRYVLVMLVNHPQAANSKAAQDALIAWVYQQQ